MVLEARAKATRSRNRRPKTERRKAAIRSGSCGHLTCVGTSTKWYELLLVRDGPPPSVVIP